MENGLMKIGEMARLNHVSTQTLRLYARIKLLEPQHLDRKTGYRYYTLEQCARLDLIHVLKSCRMPLTRIRELFSLCSGEMLIEILEEQRRVLSGEIYHLNVSNNNLNRIIKNLQDIRSLPPFGEIFLEHMPARKIDVQDTGIDFFSGGEDAYEKMLRHMQHYLHQHRLPPSYFTNIGTIMDRDCLTTGKYHASRAFIFIDEMYPKTENTQTLPPGMYLCVVLNDVSLEKKFAKKLYRETARKKLKVNGDYICEVITQLPLRGKGDLTYKIQIPVVSAGV